LGEGILANTGPAGRAGVKEQRRKRSRKKNPEKTIVFKRKTGSFFVCNVRKITAKGLFRPEINHRIKEHLAEGKWRRISGGVTFYLTISHVDGSYNL